MNTEKTISANSHGITIYHTNSGKHNTVAYGNTDYGFETVQRQGNRFKGISFQDSRKLHYDLFNESQFILYKRTLYGLAEYSEKEKAKLNAFQISRIKTKQKTIWSDMNRFKNEVMNEQADQFLSLFFHSKLASQMMREKPEPDMPNRMSFNQLGINRKMVADRLISLGYLPKNFYQIR